MFSQNFTSDQTTGVIGNHLELIKQEIINFKKAVENFDYSSLRAIDVSSGNDKFYKASDEAIVILKEMFSTKLKKSSNPAVSKFFSNILSQPNENRQIILDLADTLLDFRNNIQKSELLYFKDHKDGEALAQLRKNSTWVVYFHYIIEQYLQKDQSAYASFVKDLQELCQDCHIWIKKNANEEIEKYEYFKTINRIDHSSPKKRKFFFEEDKSTTDAQSTSSSTSQNKLTVKRKLF